MTVLVRPNNNFYANRNNTELFNKWRSSDWHILETFPQSGIIRIQTPDNAVWVDVISSEIDIIE